MPVSFARLRIAGFKSFAEPATVEIRPGLTGIVGPNGCGKSNVVEALRWAMGETSARSLRGGEMDDVIFAGTAQRPSRNIAEVVLTLEDTAGLAPPPFHEQPELQISRRIERGQGSLYRLNGAELRARDAQTLFADLATGAHASAMVGQGRVATIINARPEERRGVLEEAAGITGLHARRHEAELKLRAAEANLTRADDLRGQLEQQLDALKRQARQASRHRNLSGAIRGAEAELLSIQRASVERARAAAAAALHEAKLAVAAAAEAATSAATRTTEAAAALPPLREVEADARTALERHRIAQERLAEEETRARDALAAAAQRLTELERDRTHGEQARRDAQEAEARLAAEDAAAEAAMALYAGQSSAGAAALAETTASVREAEAAANRATEAAAEAAARGQAAGRAAAEAEARTRKLTHLHAAADAERSRLSAQIIDAGSLATADAEQRAAEHAQAGARATLDQAEHARAEAQAALARTREARQASETERARLDAQVRALGELLAVGDGELWPPMVDALAVPAGLENALGAVLGEELGSAADTEAARHWRELPAFAPTPELPPGASALATLVQAPPALARALSQIGLVAGEAAGDAGQPVLLPGQTLVDRDGAIWRWDGYTIRAGTPTAAAVRLRQRNQLNGLREQLVRVTADAEAARVAHEADAGAEREAMEAEQRARGARRETEAAAERARGRAAQMQQQASAAGARLAAAEDQLQRLEPDLHDAQAALQSSKTALAALPDAGMLRQALEQARAALGAERAREAMARANIEGLEREHRSRTARRAALVEERATWGQRAEVATQRDADLATRLADARIAHAALTEAPTSLALRRADALDALEAAEAAHRRAADVLAAGASEQQIADRASRAAETALGAAREAAVRAEAAAAQAEHDWGSVTERILERLGGHPALPDPPAELGTEAEEKARRRLERLQREREEMGPVNLRAEIEAEEVGARIGGIEIEKAELETAIAKLRGSIGHINREGRERVGTVFAEIDRHFQALFGRMFGGGRAHLALVGSDDPLQAGLEIYAQPPGKKLSTLSLLSGGEQALTALSLIFAVFRCNPAPVAVLDEVDAPLDDANVERFCALLEDMARDRGTRFLVVTHHPLTMARMDRLYGVTMQERGVSRLVSVDLHAATALVEPPRMAAE